MPAQDDAPLLLDAIENPADLRKLDAAKLVQVSQELREFLIRSVASRGDHFEASLGAVELTVALHYVFNTPHDRIVWDVGHQAYSHKALTGRRARLHTVKEHGGLAPFPPRSSGRSGAWSPSSATVGSPRGWRLRR